MQVWVSKTQCRVEARTVMLPNTELATAVTEQHVRMRKFVGRRSSHSDSATMHDERCLPDQTNLFARDEGQMFALRPALRTKMSRAQFWFVTLVTEVSLRLAPCRSPGEPNLPAI
jgi:hypothetical protein